LVNAFPNFDDEYELVVVDNYSSDGTFKILKIFAKEHPNVKLFRDKCTRGKGRDLALRNTSGDYVFFIDFDNIFERRYGITIERIRRLCNGGTFWLPFAFTTRTAAIETIGGWRNLNYAEDVEFCARAVAKGLNIKRLCVPMFLSPERVRIREARYAKGYIRYRIRKFKNIIDIIRGFNLPFELFMRDMITNNPIRLSSLIALGLFPLTKPFSFKYDNKLSNNEFIYKNEHLIFPEDIGLPKNWLFIVWEHGRWPTIKERIEEVNDRDEGLKYIFFKRISRLVCVRDIRLLDYLYDIEGEKSIKVRVINK